MHVISTLDLQLTNQVQSSVVVDFLTLVTHQLLQATGVTTTLAIHSFHIGAATTVAATRLPTTLVNKSFIQQGVLNQQGML